MLVERWKHAGVSSQELAGMLIGASHAYHAAKAEESIELVWTGPPSELVATRKTEQALLEVIACSRDALFLISFVAYHVPSIMKALSLAVDRGVMLSILLESSEEHGGAISVDSIGAMREALPAARIYYWAEKAGEYAGGKVHGKGAVCDARVCYITSANLTGHAMLKNIELGVVIRGGSIPARLHRHLETLVATRVVRRI
jgi:phosphatidylserine/phosphatidylglycerophosphate/cardiolipin synthase-like enzyme